VDGASGVQVGGQAGERWFALLVALLVGGAYLLIANWHGAIGVPRNDDWAYYDVTFGLASDGHLQLDGWMQMTFVGQALLAWPVVAVFGERIGALQAFDVVVGAIGLWASYVLIRSFLPRAGAALAVGCLALGPIFGVLTVTFMTDVPAFTLQVVTLLAGVRALRSTRVSMPWLAASLVLGFVAFSVREYACAATVAVLAVALVRARTDGSWRRVLLAGGAWAILAVGFYAWRASLPNGFSPHIDIGARAVWTSAKVGWSGALTLGLMLIPAAVMVSPVALVRAVWTRARAAGVAVVLVAAAATLAAHAELTGSYFTQSGANPGNLTGSAPHLYSGFAWAAVRCVAVYSLLVVALLAVLLLAELRAHESVRVAVDVAARRSALAVVVVFAFVTAALALLALLLTDAPFYDRYVIPLVPFSAAVTIWSARRLGLTARTAPTFAVAALAIFALIGLRSVDAADALDAAKWRLASEVEDAGYDAATIDGGFEWFADHQPDAVQIRPNEPDRGFWITLFTERPVCATSAYAGSQLAGAGREIADVEERALFGPAYHLVAVEGPTPCDLGRSLASIGGD
jgi:hypothetical protein